MSFLSLIKIMIRRWTVVLPVLVLTALAGIVLIVSAETTFSLAGTELLVSAQDDGDNAGSAGRITPDAAGEIVSSAIDQPSFRRQFEQRGLLGDYDISGAISTTVITVSINGDTEELVLATAEALIDDAIGALAGVVGAESAKDVRVFAVADPTLDDVVSTATQRSLSITLAVLESGAAVVNPFPPNQPTVRALLDLALRPAVKTAVEDVAPDVEYLVEAIPRDTAPIISFSVSSSNVDELEPAYVALIAALGDELVELQSGANVRSDLTVFQTLVPPTDISQSSASIVRSAVALALLGAAAAAALAVAVDGAIIRRRDASGELLASLDKSASGSGLSEPLQRPSRTTTAKRNSSDSGAAAKKQRVRSQRATADPGAKKRGVSKNPSRTTTAKRNSSDSGSGVKKPRVRSQQTTADPEAKKQSASKNPASKNPASKNPASKRPSRSTAAKQNSSGSGPAAKKPRVGSQRATPDHAAKKGNASTQPARSASSKRNGADSDSAAQNRPARSAQATPDAAADKH